MSVLVGASLAALLLVAAPHPTPSPSPAAAQSVAGDAGGEADIAEVFRYVLTQDGLDKFLAATEAVRVLVDSTPALEQRMRSQPPAARTLDAGVRSLEQDFPEVARLVRQHGLSTRDYVVMGGALSAAFTAVSLKRNGAASDYPAALLPGNAALVERNYARLESVMQIEEPPDGAR